MLWTRVGVEFAVCEGSVGESGRGVICELTGVSMCSVGGSDRVEC